MKRILAILILAAYTTLAYADGCTTHTIMQGGRIITCTTCCYFGNCNTTCF